MLAFRSLSASYTRRLSRNSAKHMLKRAKNRRSARTSRSLACVVTSARAWARVSTVLPKRRPVFSPCVGLHTLRPLLWWQYPSGAHIPTRFEQLESLLRPSLWSQGFPATIHLARAVARGNDSGCAHYNTSALDHPPRLGRRRPRRFHPWLLQSEPAQPMN